MTHAIDHDLEIRLQLMFEQRSDLLARVAPRKVYTDEYMAELNAPLLAMTQQERDDRALQSFAAESAKYGAD
jgi:hypothetical protein